MLVVLPPESYLDEGDIIAADYEGDGEITVRTRRAAYAISPAIPPAHFTGRSIEVVAPAGDEAVTLRRLRYFNPAG